MSAMFTPVTEEERQEYDFQQILNSSKEDEGIETGRIIANYLLRVRNANSEIKSVSQEESLKSDAQKAVKLAQTAGRDHMGLSVQAIARLNDDQRYRARVARWVMVFASHLYPLSYLIYRVPNVEDIFVRDPYTVLALSGADRQKFTHMWDDIAKAKNVSVEEACITFFQDLLPINGVGGDNTGLNRINPIAEATFGSVVRIMVAIRPAASGRSPVEAAIRVHGGSKISNFQDGYVKTQAMDPAMANFLEAAIRGKANILVSGGTSTGKTTFIRVCARYFEPDCICTVIEDNAELHLDQLGPDKKPWTNYTASLATVVSARGDQDQIITMAGLVRNALRFRPDRIIVGEARGAEMAEVAKALTSGHDGSFTSIHADSSIEALDKGAQLMGEDPRYHNVEYAKETMHRAFDLVVHLARFKGRRVIESIAVVSRGNSQLVYSMTEAGAWITHIHHVDNIPKLKLKEALRTYFRDGILPVTGGGLADGVR